MPSWKHQQKEFEEGRDERSRALLWVPRAGKSKPIIDKACYQFGEGNIEGAIVIAPNGVHLNWSINEIPRWCWSWESDHKVVAWETPKIPDFEFQRELEDLLTFPGMKWLTINMEALTRPECRTYIRRFLNACNRKFMLAISEAHHFGHAGTKRTTKARDLASYARFVTIETGTPILNSPLRAYSLYKILLGSLPSHINTYEDFCKHFCVIGDDEELKSRYPRLRRRAYKKIKEYKNMPELRALIAPTSSVVLREEQDLPPLLPMQRISTISDEQRAAYIEMAGRFLLEIGDDMVTAEDAGPRMMKLQQILMGYIKDTENGRTLDINPEAPVYGDILDECLKTLDATGGTGKTIIWFRYREDIERMLRLLRKHALHPLEFHGGIPAARREPTRLLFQDIRNKHKVLVGTAATGAEGRDFSAARTIIFGSSTPNAIHVAQGMERGTAMGGEPTSVIRVRFPGTVDDRNWDIVDGKFTLADSVSGHGLRDLLRATNV